MIGPTMCYYVWGKMIGCHPLLSLAQLLQRYVTRVLDGV